MKFGKIIVVLMIFAAIQFPCTTHAASEEDRELSLIAAEQERSSDDEKLGEINPALTESITTNPTEETDKERRERKKKLKQARKEKEKENERKLKESANQKDKHKETRQDKRRKEQQIVIEPNEPKKVEPVNPEPEPVEPIETPQPVEPIETYQPPSQPIETPQPVEPIETPQPIETYQPPSQPIETPQPQPVETYQPSIVETVSLPDQKVIQANFAEVARAVKFIPLYMPRKSGYEITALYAANGVAEIHYGRRWEPSISLKVRTYKRAPGEEPQDISGVTGVKWRVDTTTGTTIYIAKISETQQVAAWAVGHYTFSAQAENLSYAGFHSLVADELVELSTHYYLDL